MAVPSVWWRRCGSGSTCAQSRGRTSPPNHFDGACVSRQTQLLLVWGERGVVRALKGGHVVLNTALETERGLRAREKGCLTVGECFDEGGGGMGLKEGRGAVLESRQGGWGGEGVLPPSGGAEAGEASHSKEGGAEAGEASHSKEGGAEAGDLTAPAPDCRKGGGAGCGGEGEVGGQRQHIATARGTVRRKGGRGHARGAAHVHTKGAGRGLTASDPRSLPRPRKCPMRSPLHARGRWSPREKWQGEGPG